MAAPSLNAKSLGMASLLLIPAGGASYFFLSKPAPSPAYAVCLTSPLDFADKSVSGCLPPGDVPGLIARPVSLKNFGGGGNVQAEGLKMEAANEGAPPRAVHSCAEYDAAVREGRYALSTADMSLESYFKRECGVLNAVAKAQPAQRSYISDPRISLANLNLVSANAVALIAENVPPGRTLSDLVENGTASVKRDGYDRIEISAGSSKGDLVEIARGDFNGDGIEDILAFQSVHAEGGTLRAYDTVLLTRRSATGPLEVTR